MRAPFSWPDHPQRPPPTNTITLGVRFQYTNFGVTQTINLAYTLNNCSALLEHASESQIHSFTHSNTFFFWGHTLCQLLGRPWWNSDEPNRYASWLSESDGVTEGRWRGWGEALTEPNRTLHFGWQVVTGALKGHYSIRWQSRGTPSSRELKSSLWMDTDTEIARIGVDYVEGGMWDRSTRGKGYLFCGGLVACSWRIRRFIGVNLEKLNSSAFSGMSFYPLALQGWV